MKKTKLGKREYKSMKVKTKRFQKKINQALRKLTFSSFYFTLSIFILNGLFNFSYTIEVISNFKN